MDKKQDKKSIDTSPATLFNQEKYAFSEAEQYIKDSYKETFRQQVKRMLETPQYNQNHHEGPQVKDHIKKIYEAYYDVSSNRKIDSESWGIHANFCNYLNNKLQDISEQDWQYLKIYGILHDLGKPDTLQLKFEDNSRRDIGLEEAKNIFNNNCPPYKQNGAVIQTLTNHHKNKTHGEVGAKLLKQISTLPDKIIKPIKNHECVYDFNQINASLFEQYFGNWDEDTLNILFAGAFLDAAGSFNKNKEPDFSTLENMFLSMKNYEILQSINKKFGLDENHYNRLAKADYQLAKKEVKKYSNYQPNYDIQNLNDQLTSLIEKNNLNISKSKLDEIIKTAEHNPDNIMQKIGPLFSPTGYIDKVKAILRNNDTNYPS